MAGGLQQCDVLISCALEEEADAVEHEFSHRYRVSFQSAFSTVDRYRYRYTTIQNSKNEPLTILLISQARPGPLETGDHIKPLLQEFCPRFAAMTGICAGDKRKVELGDLIVAEYAYHYEEGKVGIDRDGERIHHPEWITHGTAKRVLQYVHNFKTWEEPVGEMKRFKMERELKDAEWPKRFIAPMASGMAVRSDDPFPDLQRHNRKTLALDQEAAAFYRTLHEFPDIYPLVVKGVCDYADPTKNDTHHEYAARASAIYLLEFIKEYVTDETMPRRDSVSHQSRDGPYKVFNVPYRRNPFFTGREDLLQLLHYKLTVSKAAALTQPQAISGLGGIGKTQTAVEYAYRHSSDYQAILWARAESYGVLLTDFVEFAYLLDLPEKNDRNQDRIVAAVKRWLHMHTSWLLILDNVEDLEMVSNFLPQANVGHILLTTRAQAVGGLAECIDLEKMDSEVGALFLLCRAKIVAPGALLSDASAAHQTSAREISQVMDGLPLALDQAGAYIEETKCSLPQYLSLYQEQRAKLLKRRGQFASDHPDSVTTTFSLSFEKIERANWSAARLLEFCAFLDPDIIPEEIVANWAYRFNEFRPSFESFYRHYAKNQFELDKMIEELLKYSLVRRHPDEQTLSIHRLVQAVLMDRMSRKRKRRCEGRVVITVTDVFPRPTTVSWPNCQRYLSHAQICLALIDQWKLTLISTPSWEFSASAELLEKAGDYLRQRARYKEAELMYEQLLKMEEKRKKIWGKSSDSFDGYRVIDKLARVYTYQGKYSRAGDLLLVDGLAYRYRQSVVQQIPLYNIRDLPDDWPQVMLHNAIAKLLHDYHDLRDAVIYNNVAKIFYDAGNPVVADSVFQGEALKIWKGVTPVASGYSGFHTLLYKRRITVDGYVYLKAALLNNEAVLLIPLDPKQAESSLKLALTTQESQLGSEHPETAGYLNNLASLYLLQGEYMQAEPLFQRALKIRQNRLGKVHPEVAISLNNLASLYSVQGEYGWAEPLFQQALQIQEQCLKPDHIDRVRVLKSYTILLQKVGRMDEAANLEQRAEAILLAVQEQENIGQNPLLVGTHQKPVWSHPGLYFAWCPPEIY